MQDVATVVPGASVRLQDLPTRGSLQKAEAKEALDDLREDLVALHQRLWETKAGPVIVLLQGPDTAGKDSVIRSVFSGLLPQAMEVHAFGVPTAEEASHDFLWRYHRLLPGRGRLAILNRTWYESVLVERVDALVPKKVWTRRYEHINAFESLLVESGVRLLKVMLHVSKAEQARRLEARRTDPAKAWKHQPHDARKHRQYAQYEAAYEDALSHCCAAAPWHVVPADHRASRNLAVARLLQETLEASL